MLDFVEYAPCRNRTYNPVVKITFRNGGNEPINSVFPARWLFGPVPGGPDDMELLHTFEAGFLTTANRFVALATAAEQEPELTKGYVRKHH